RSTAIANTHIEIQRLFPHRNKKYEVTSLTKVFLRDLQLDCFTRLVQCSEERRCRLAYLKIDRAVLNLNDDVVIELPVEVLEIVVRGTGAIVFRIFPIHVVVVHEPTIEDHTPVRLERSRYHIRSVRMGAAIRRRTDTSFRVCFQYEATEIRNRAIDVIDFRFPPGTDGRIERVERIEAAESLRTSEVHSYRDLHAPGTQRICDARDLRNQIASENTRIRIDVVDGTAVDSKRCEHPAILADAAHVCPGVLIFPEDRWSAVATLDRAIQVVPLVDPPDRHCRRLLIIQFIDSVAERNLAEQCKRAVENALRIASDDQNVACTFDAGSLQPVRIRGQAEGNRELRGHAAEFIRRAEENCVIGGQSLFGAQSTSEHSENAANHLLPRRLLHHILAQNGNG